MKILVTNDDGVFAPGIRILAEALSENGHSPVVVAPDRERSSVGHAITLTRPLRLWNIEGGAYVGGFPVYACDGTPSDSVVLGLEEVCPKADLVVSGINRGPNLADDLTYSGTVSAAMEGHFLGKPALAVSLNCGSSETLHHYDAAASAMVRILEVLHETILSNRLLLNVNVPNLSHESIRGFRVTRKGVRKYREKINRLNDPKGRAYYWISGKPEDALSPGSDVLAVSEGYVSVTPIHMDMTHFPSIDMLKDRGLESLHLHVMLDKSS
ncbi:MAG: 5'/3'-nucleotidase SurE, partial [Synergistota bacterium]|nr:5'/3'-nucleotidase SurE [Synergistota bacterium]